MPEYLHVTQSLAATVDKVKYVIDRRQGLTVIYGDVGHGKSTVLRWLYNEYRDREDAVAGYLPTPQYKTDVGLLRAVSGEFGLPVRRSMQDQEHQLRAYLLEQYLEGRNCVVFVDEAQIIPGKVLELLRLLLNLETDEAKLIQVVLGGQLELRDRLRDPSKKALRSRIFITSTLDPLTLDETKEVLLHRCRLFEIRMPFPDEAVERIWATSKGVPRQALTLAGLSYHLTKQNGIEEVPVEAIDLVATDMEPV